CAQSLPLAVKRMVLKPMGLHVHGNRLKVKARYAASASALFDPTAQDTTLQISDANGELFCQTIAAAHWKHPHRRLYRFKGKKVVLRATGGDNVLVTVRVGNQCARERMDLRTTKKAIVFP